MTQRAGRVHTLKRRNSGYETYACTDKTCQRRMKIKRNRDDTCEVTTEPRHKDNCEVMNVEQMRDLIGIREMRSRAENPLEIEKATADIILDHKVSSLH